MITRNVTRVAFICFLILAQLSIVSAQGVLLSGHVLRASDRQAVQAGVVLYSISTNSNGAYVPISKTMTDAQGAYSFMVAPDSKVTVQAYPTDPQYRSTYYPDAVDIQGAKFIAMSQMQSGIDIVVPQATTQTYTLSGMISTLQGQAVDAMVVISGANSTTQSYTLTTDPQKTGWFSLDLKSPGAFFVQVLPTTTAFGAGYYRANDVVTPTVNQASIVNVGTQGTSATTIQVFVSTTNGSTTFGLKGIVVDMSKQPIAGATISVVDASGTIVNTPNPCVSGKDGTYSCTVASAGSYQVICDAVGYVANTQTVVLDGKNAAQYLNFIMTEANPPQYNNAVWGTVVGIDGQPLAAKVQAMMVSNSAGTNDVVSATTASDAKTGNFEFDNLKPGTYFLYAISGDARYGAGYYVVNATADPSTTKATAIAVQENAKNDKAYVITLGKANANVTYTLWAFVVDENNAPLADVVFQATDANGNDVLLNQNTTTDKGGMVQLVFPGEGTYTVRATKDGYQDGVGTISFSSGFFAEKAMVQLKKKDQTSGNESAQIVAGVSELSNAISSLAPQPAQAQVKISLTNAASADQVKLYSMNGEEVLQQRFEATSALSLDLQTLNSGCYEVRLFSQGQLVARSMLIKN